MANENGNREWLTAMELGDESLRGNTMLNRYESQEAQLAAHIEASGRLGRSITIPGEDAGEEALRKFNATLVERVPTLMQKPDATDEAQMRAYHETIGVPADINGYTTPEVEGLNEEAKSTAKSFAHKLHMPKEMHSAFVQLLAEENEQVNEAVTQAIAEDTAIVSGKWGQAEEQRKKAIESVRTQFVDPDHPPSEMRAGDYLMWQNVVNALSGKGPQAFQQPAGGDGLTPDEINDKIADIDNRLMEEGRTMVRSTYKGLIEKKSKLLQMRTN